MHKLRLERFIDQQKNISSPERRCWDSNKSAAIGIRNLDAQNVLLKNPTSWATSQHQEQ